MTCLQRAESNLKLAIEGSDAAVRFGFTWFSYLCLQVDKFDAISTYPSMWVEHYRTQNYAEIDGAIDINSRRTESFTWTTKVASKSCGPRSCRLAEDAEKFGIVSGLTIPLRCYRDARWMIVFASNDASLLIDPHAERIGCPARLWAEEFHSLGSELNQAIALAS